MGNGLSRLQSRFYGATDELLADCARARSDARPTRLELGPGHRAPDDIDWEDEIRLVVEGRAALSPGRAAPAWRRTTASSARRPCETKIFGRLTAWQNWIFIRPNASGPEGALRRYGTGPEGRVRQEAGVSMTHAPSTTTTRSPTTSTCPRTAGCSGRWRAGSPSS